MYDACSDSTTFILCQDRARAGNIHYTHHPDSTEPIYRNSHRRLSAKYLGSKCLAGRKIDLRIKPFNWKWSVIYNIGLRNKLNRNCKTTWKSLFKKRPFQGFIIQQGHAADILITDGNTGPSGATPAHLLCHDARAYLEPCQFRRGDNFCSK